MGYESSLHLIDVRIKPESVLQVSQALSDPTTMTDLESFLKVAVIDSGGFLAFKTSEDELDPYVPDDNDGTVPALYGKWYAAEQIANWLKQHSEEGGRIILHSIEADGAAWGWEFNGKGQMRALDTFPSGNGSRNIRNGWG